MAPKAQTASNSKSAPAKPSPKGAAIVAATPNPDMDSDEDEDEEGGVSAGGAGGLTPALQKPEENAAPMTPKNFRNHPDMENFFRFIYENDLRLEALDIVDEIIVQRTAKRKKN